MIIGDWVRVKPESTWRDLLGVADDSVGIVKDVDHSSPRTSVLISFPDLDLYTSVLQAGDLEVLDEHVLQ